MPDFFIRSLESWEKTGTHGVTQPKTFYRNTNPDIQDGWRQRGYWEKQLGWKEHLLCEICEKRFEVHETKVKDYLYGNAPAPLKKRILGKSVPLPAGTTSDVLEVRELDIDYKELKLFQMSLLWRAGVAKGQWFHTIDLGQKHEKNLRQFFLNDNPGSEKDYPCVMCDLRSSGVDFELFWQEPISCHDDDQGQRLYKIIIGGYAFMYSVSSHQPSQMIQSFCAKPTGKMFLQVVKGDIFLQRCATRLRKAGKLSSPSRGSSHDSSSGLVHDT